MSDKLSEGQLLARARDEWIESEEGKQCAEVPGAYGQYLRNRLVRAFIAGWNAARAHNRSTP